MTDLLYQGPGMPCFYIVFETIRISYLLFFRMACFFFFYREAETVDPRSGHPVPQGDSSKSFARFWG